MSNEQSKREELIDDEREVLQAAIEASPAFQEYAGGRLADAILAAGFRRSEVPHSTRKGATMSDEQSIRDELVDRINAELDKWGEGSPSPYAVADAISPVIRRIQAEALREAADELWRVTKDCDEHCDDDWRYRLQSKADAIERGETA